MSSKVQNTKTFQIGGALTPGDGLTGQTPTKIKQTKQVKAVKANKEDKVSRLEQYAELDKNHPLNRPFQGKATFRGPVCTNLALLILF